MEAKFQKFGGESIDNLGEYVRNYLDRYPATTVFVGSDAAERGKHTLYATVVAFYDEFRKDGVHYIFRKEMVESQKMWVEKTGDKVKDKAAVKSGKEANIFGKIWGEVERVLEIGQYLEKELEGFIPRKTSSELIKLGYSSHQNKLVGLDVDINLDPGFKIPEDLQGKVEIRSRKYYVDEKNDRLVNVYNPDLFLYINDLTEEELKYVIEMQTTQPAKLRSFLMSMPTKDVKNKSQLVYEAARAALEGQGFRTRYKPFSWAANSAADMVCDKQKKRRKGKAERKRRKKAA